MWHWCNGGWGSWLHCKLRSSKWIWCLHLWLLWIWAIKWKTNWRERLCGYRIGLWIHRCWKKWSWPRSMQIWHSFWRHHKWWFIFRSFSLASRSEVPLPPILHPRIFHLLLVLFLSLHCVPLSDTLLGINLPKRHPQLIASERKFLNPMVFDRSQILGSTKFHQFVFHFCAFMDSKMKWCHQEILQKFMRLPHSVLIPYLFQTDVTWVCLAPSELGGESKHSWKKTLKNGKRAAPKLSLAEPMKWNMRNMNLIRIPKV